MLECAVTKSALHFGAVDYEFILKLKDYILEVSRLESKMRGLHCGTCADMRLFELHPNGIFLPM